MRNGVRAKWQRTSPPTSKFNLPAPERFAVHKLLEYGERPVSERTKFTKDLLQAASLVSFFADKDQAEVFNAAWRDALARGKGWAARATRGRAALIALEPTLSNSKLWA
jgi:hypothetical protein